MEAYTPFDLTDECWSKLPAREEYFPRHRVERSLVVSAYNRMDCQVHPGGLTYLFPYYATLGGNALAPIFPSSPTEIRQVLLEKLRERGVLLEKEADESSITPDFLASLLHSSCPKAQAFVREMTARLWNTGGCVRIWLLRSRSGILPQFEHELGIKRGTIRNLMTGADTTQADRRVYDIKQKQIKVIMNAAYGIMVLTDKLLAGLITQIGRRTTANIQIAGQLMDRRFTCRYGDTDSTFFYIKDPLVKRTLSPDGEYLDMDLLLEEEYKTRYIREINEHVWGIKYSSFNMSRVGKSVMCLLPERLIILANIWGKKNYVFLHWRDESAEYQALVDALARGNDTPQYPFRVIPRTESSMMKVINLTNIDHVEGL